VFPQKKQNNSKPEKALNSHHETKKIYKILVRTRRGRADNRLVQLAVRAILVGVREKENAYKESAEGVGRQDFDANK